MLSIIDTKSTGISVLFTSMLVNGRTSEGNPVLSTSTMENTLHFLLPISTHSSPALKLSIATGLSEKSIVK